MQSPMKAIAEALRNGSSFLVAAHYNPDGDAIGSTAALGHVLTALGKEVTLFNHSGTNCRYDWVKLPSPIVSELPEKLPEWTIILDCGNDERMGETLRSRLDETRVINIDHHLGNPMFGELNWVDVSHPAVGTMIAALAEELDVPLDGPIAEAVYMATSTDTGFFTYGNTTPESLELAAKLLRNGLDLQTVNMNITKQWTENRLRLTNEVLGGVELFENGQVAVAPVTREMFERTGTVASDTEEIINFVRKLKSVRVAALLREEGDEQWKFSLRAYGEDNVQEVAASFDGGGHKNAAGGMVYGTLEEARKTLVERITTMLGL
ncbi:bifunctional oligoribonuclease/PAP phosphatase NrnA [Salidesulfovibrio brasiliensis]